MRTLKQLFTGNLASKAALIAAGAVVIGGGAAIAAPGITPTSFSTAENDGEDEQGDGDEIQVIEPGDLGTTDAESDGENGDEVEEPTLQDLVDRYCNTYEDDDAPEICDADEVDVDALRTYCDAAEDGTTTTRFCDFIAPHLEDDEGDEGTDDEGTDDEGDEGSENAQAFAAFVQSIPSDWGCIRGQLVSYVARNGPQTSDFEALFEDEGFALLFGDGIGDASAEDVAEFLEMTDHPCTRGVLDADGNGDTADSDNDDTVESSENGTVEEEQEPQTRGRPDHAGAPSHAGPPEHANAPEDAGPPDHARRGNGNGANDNG